MILPKKDLTLFQTALKVGAVYTSGGKGYVIRALFRLCLLYTSPSPRDA